MTMHTYPSTAATDNKTAFDFVATTSHRRRHWCAHTRCVDGDRLLSARIQRRIEGRAPQCTDVIGTVCMGSHSSQNTESSARKLGIGQECAAQGSVCGSLAAGLDHAHRIQMYNLAFYCAFTVPWSSKRRLHSMCRPKSATTPISTRPSIMRPTWASCSVARRMRCRPIGSTCPSATMGEPVRWWCPARRSFGRTAKRCRSTGPSHFSGHADCW